MTWQNQFKNRIDDFENHFNDGTGVTISIKIRVDSGCFHRECSPHAYAIIDKELTILNPKKEKAVLIEHESGPEILVYLTIVSGSITLTTAIINIVTAIINARKKGIELGDRPNSSINLIIRNFDKKGKIKEEKIFTIDRSSSIDKKIIKDILEKGIKKLLEDKN
jgi:hypothetical protein